MVKKYSQLTYEKMVKIETLLVEDYSHAEIGVRIGKDRTSVWRCVTKYQDADSIFRADSAWKKFSEKKTQANKNYRILPESILEKFILEKIELHWSPQEIAGRWSFEQKESLCHETIYQFVYKHHPELVKLYFRRKGKKYIHKRKEKYRIMDRRMIDERPKDIEKRTEFGHWEGDTIVGQNHQGAIVH